MARLSKEEQARYAGAEWCLRMIEEKGIEETKKDLMNRGAQNCPLGLLESDRRKYIEETFKHVYRSLVCLALLTLKDEFKFGKERLKKFMLRFENKADCLNYELVTWEDYEQCLFEETGLTVKKEEED